MTNYRFLWRVSTSATIPAEVRMVVSVNLVVLDCTLDRILKPADILVSVATVTKSAPAIAVLAKSKLG